MSLFKHIACLIGRHDPQRRYVKWDGFRYVGTCKYCGKDIHRIAHRDWRAMDGQSAKQSKSPATLTGSS
ncbi:MAG: hypothetical protein SXU28_05200 [Pseudomonadota bacterium]|nr:hypothetical protein [Pseudomonadota bacterium]